MFSTIVWLLFVLVYYAPVIRSNDYNIWPIQVVGIDRKNGYRIMSFQELSTRGRGSKDTLVAKESIKVGNSHAWKKLQKFYSKVANSGMTIIAGWYRYAIRVDNSGRAALSFWERLAFVQREVCRPSQPKFYNAIIKREFPCDLVPL